MDDPWTTLRRGEPVDPFDFVCNAAGIRDGNQLEVVPNLEYYQARLREAEQKKAQAVAWNEAQAEAAAKRAYRAARREHIRQLLEENAIRYETEQLLHRVRQWNAPAEAQDFKKRLIKQLEQAIQRASYGWEPPKELSGDEHRRAVIAEADHNIEFHTREIANAQQQAKEKTAWRTVVFESLGWQFRGPS